jgi:hypothetical protein
VRTVVWQETGRGRLVSAFAERRWPALVVLAVCAGLASVAMAFGTAPPPAVVLLRLAAYLVASRLARRLSIPVVGAAAIGLGAALLYAASTTTGIPLAAEAVESLLPGAGAAATQIGGSGIRTRSQGR